MLRRRPRPLALALALLPALVACGAQPLGPGNATLSVVANLSGTLVATVVVEVTAPDIPTTLVFNIPISNGVASGTITIPAGANRTITVRGYDAAGVLTHSGSATVTIQAGANPAVSIVLTSLTGDVPITVTLRAFVVVVTPVSASLSLAGTTTVHLTAAVTDPLGNPVSAVVAWATRNPGVATVDGTGLVTAAAVGSTSISAIVHGVAGTATITVTP